MPSLSRRRRRTRSPAPNDRRGLETPPQGGPDSAAVALLTSNGDSPSPKRGSEAGASFTDKPWHTGFGCISHAQSPGIQGKVASS